MSDTAPMTNGAGAPVLHGWTARRMRPAVLAYVVLVFALLTAVAHFVVHSPTAVKALLLGAVGYLVPLAPNVLARVEYRLTVDGLERRRAGGGKAGEFAEVFRWADLERVVPTRDGFRYHKPLDEPKAVKRFFKAHFSDAYSGEFRVEEGDRAAVRGVLARQGFAAGAA